MLHRLNLFSLYLIYIYNYGRLQREKPMENGKIGNGGLMGMNS